MRTEWLLVYFFTKIKYVYIIVFLQFKKFNIIFYEQKRNNIKREYNIVLGIVTTYVWLKE